MAGMFKGLPPGIRMDLERALPYINRGEPVPNPKVDEIRMLFDSCRNLQYMNGLEHLQNVSLRRLAGIVTRLGMDKTVEIAKRNLSAFHFLQAVQKEV